MIISRISAVMFSIILLAVAAVAHAEGPLETQNDMLVNKSGMTVYTFDKDDANSGSSNCYDDCATNWPPVEADANAKAEGDYSIIERKDGTRQWAYQGQPLYTYAKDMKAGDKTGDDIGGMWHIVKP